MQFMRQLNDDELTDLLLESDERELLPLIDTLPASLRSASEKPEWFWQRQQASIRGHVAQRRDWTRPALTWAATMALFVLAIVLLRGGTPAAPVVQKARVDPDQELLVAVEQAVHSDVPDSLEPAMVLANEIGGYTPTRSAAQKEKHNAE